MTLGLILFCAEQGFAGAPLGQMRCPKSFRTHEYDVGSLPPPACVRPRGIMSDIFGPMHLQSATFSSCSGEHTMKTTGDTQHS
jgi:hypothetical protein